MQDESNSQAASTLRTEPGSKRVRAYLAGHLVLDTIRPLLVWEVADHPLYYVPRDDVVAELVDTGHTKESRRRGTMRLRSVRVEKHKAVNAAVTFEESTIPALRDLVRVDWNEMDAWFEEDEQVFVHPRDPYRRIDMLATSRHVKVESRGEVVAETTNAVAVFETGRPVHYYVPKPFVRFDLLDHSSTVDYCAYRGEAEYWHVAIGKHEFPDAAWSYRRTPWQCTRIAAMVSFDPAQLDVVVDGVKQG